jgi:hypothetical protein
MNKLGFRIIIIILAARLLLGCQSIYDYSVQPTNMDAEATTKNSCPALPSTFTESDLIGTWLANYSPHDMDTLIIKDNGLYMQIYDSPDAGLHYESGWQEWWIERRLSGYIRLHLKGMRRAGEVDSIFNREGGGIDPELFRSIDYCEGDEVTMPDEIILIVTGTNYDTPRGIILRQTRLAGSEWTNSFHLEDNQVP